MEKLEIYEKITGQKTELDMSSKDARNRLDELVEEASTEFKSKLMQELAPKSLELEQSSLKQTADITRLREKAAADKLSAIEAALGMPLEASTSVEIVSRIVESIESSVGETARVLRQRRGAEQIENLMQTDNLMQVESIQRILVESGLSVLEAKASAGANPGEKDEYVAVDAK